MNTYKYNLFGEIKHVRGVDRFTAWLNIFHGELKRIGKCNIKPQDLKLVRNPREGRGNSTREIMNNTNACDLDNDISRVKITNQLRHI